MNILVIYGGGSSEREVSLRSGASVAAALEKAGHEVNLYDPHDDATFSELPTLVKGIDVAFPIIHGKGAEDGAVQAELERLGVPFVGSSSEVSAQCLNKWETLQKVKAAGIPTADSQVVTFDDLPNSPLVKKPFVLKPLNEGSSVDTFIVKDPGLFVIDAVESAFERHGKMLLEAFIEGTELTVPILDETALPVIEIIPPEGGDFDYENKYNGKTQELCPAQSVSEEIQQKAQDMAVKAHKLMGCRDLSRSDIMVDKQGRLYFLEVNTLPGMTDQSLYPKAAGVDMSVLMDRLVQAAADRR